MSNVESLAMRGITDKGDKNDESLEHFEDGAASCLCSDEMYYESVMIASSDCASMCKAFMQTSSYLLEPLIEMQIFGKIISRCRIHFNHQVNHQVLLGHQRSSRSPPVNRKAL